MTSSSTASMIMILETFSDDESSEHDASVSESEIDEETRQCCVHGGPMTNEMGGCDGENCAVQWWHYEHAGMTTETIPGGEWYCSQYLSA